MDLSEKQFIALYTIICVILIVVHTWRMLKNKISLFLLCIVLLPIIYFAFWVNTGMLYRLSQKMFPDDLFMQHLGANAFNLYILYSIVTNK